MNFKSIKEKMKNFLNKVWDFVLPDNLECIFCGAEIGDKNEYSTCPKCLEIYLKRTTQCEKCGEYISSKSKYCYSCKKHIDYNYEIARAPFVYVGGAKRVVAKFKYSGARWLAKYMALFMKEEYDNMHINCDVLVPVPLHKTKLKTRGYNQSLVLAEELSKLLNLPISNSLIKIKPTKTQTKLTKDERRENLVGTFNVENNSDIWNKNILLIDDVFTTGATIEECSRVLMREGVNKVYVLTFAHTSRIIKFEKPDENKKFKLFKSKK